MNCGLPTGEPSGCGQPVILLSTGYFLDILEGSQGMKVKKGHVRDLDLSPTSSCHRNYNTGYLEPIFYNSLDLLAFDFFIKGFGILFFQNITCHIGRGA